MRRKILFVLVFLCAALCWSTQSRAQSEPQQVYKPWKMLGESQTKVDVYYRSVLCSDKKQVHLRIFAESHSDQQAWFEIKITDVASGDSITKEVQFQATRATEYKAACATDTTTDYLKVNLPEHFDPAAITVSIVFKS